MTSVWIIHHVVHIVAIVHAHPTLCIPEKCHSAASSVVRQRAGFTDHASCFHVRHEFIHLDLLICLLPKDVVLPSLSHGKGSSQVTTWRREQRPKQLRAALTFFKAFRFPPQRSAASEQAQDCRSLTLVLPDQTLTAKSSTSNCTRGRGTGAQAEGRTG